eukprot:GILJ01010390.1.p1 GENE.GILJ01010390.1~~GILJ01010390.1.p1  ORF type:complete len:278 (-),score=5.30 GILJ01010390.1:160-993(-)
MASTTATGFTNVSFYAKPGKTKRYHADGTPWPSESTTQRGKYSKKNYKKKNNAGRDQDLVFDSKIIQDPSQPTDGTWDASGTMNNTDESVTFVEMIQAAEFDDFEYEVPADADVKGELQTTTEHQRRVHREFNAWKNIRPRLFEDYLFAEAEYSVNLDVKNLVCFQCLSSGHLSVARCDECAPGRILCTWCYVHIHNSNEARLSLQHRAPIRYIDSLVQGHTVELDAAVRREQVPLRPVHKMVPFPSQQCRFCHHALFGCKSRFTRKLCVRLTGTNL